jgi:hypothetical protein
MESGQSPRVSRFNRRALRGGYLTLVTDTDQGTYQSNAGTVFRSWRRRCK